MGAKIVEVPKKSHKAVNDFIQGIAVIPIFNCADRYADKKVRLRKNSTPMHDEFDLLIGVTALKNTLKLVTDNTKDFISLNLKTENWYKRKI
jgi:tRNA(fMet)-specific endonuclease VapC